MNRLLNFFYSLFGASALVEEDHLMGAVDLTDSYCADLVRAGK